MLDTKNFQRPFKDWCIREAEKILQRTSNHSIIHFGAGFGPSGLPHIGTLCEVIRTSFVMQALQEISDLKSKLFIISDDMDALRKVPDNFPQKKMLEQHIGIPLYRIPDPFGDAASLSEGINQRLISALNNFDLRYEFIRSSDAYIRGDYNTELLNFLKNHKIINEVVAASVNPIRRQSYSIFMPISPFTGRVIEHTRILDVDEAGSITYEIPRNIIIQRPGIAYGLEPETYYVGEPIGKPTTVSILNGQCKLQWKADWCMRLISRNISFEMHGEDLSDSAKVVRQICGALQTPPPQLYKYGLFYDEKGKKISKSKGNGFSIEQLDKYLSRESFRLFLYRQPKRSNRFAPLLAPRINDDVRLELHRTNSPKHAIPATLRLHRIGLNNSSFVLNFKKLINVLSACSPVDYPAAVEFAGPEHPVLTKAWNFYKDHVASKREKVFCNASEIEALKSFTLFLKTNPETTIDNHLREHIEQCRKTFTPELDCHQFYQLLYRAFTRASSGPKIRTWLRVTGIEKSISIIEQFIQENDEPSLIKQTENVIALSNFTSKKEKKTESFVNYPPVDFNAGNKQALAFADLLIEKQEQIAKSLSEYECHHVVIDEIERCVEFLKNLNLNKAYFKGRVRGVTTFLPLNQPIYASVCFGVVPSLMAEDVCIRPPTVMHRHYKKLNEVLSLEKYFPNLSISYEDKEPFVANRVSITDVVIFTGTAENANKVRRYFSRKTLFIFNGAGHNPLVVTETADIPLAIESALRVVLYNQGQDCAGPNSILVHQSIYEKFKTSLFEKLKDMEDKVGAYNDPNNIVGPNSDPDHALKVIQYFKEDRRYCIYGGEINAISGLIRPTLFEKPLELGGNYKEFFAPVFYLQPYQEDADLKLYFENPKYFPNAMYISLFGQSEYIKTLINVSHLPESIFYNTDLHLEEKGYLPYGGLGPAASCLYVNGERVNGATLPQRDIYQYLVKPSLTSQDITHAEPSIG